ncbi:MAG: glycosyltransferase [Chryseolinea sp.]
MSRLLTITIPTYKRAQMLHDQFAWLSEELRGHEQHCDIVVSDNCSPDHTTDVIVKWRSEFVRREIPFTNYRHAENIGGMANIVASINAATGTYVWTLGDDDEINRGTLPYILKLLKRHSSLSLIMLDGIGRHAHTMEIKHPRFFDSTSDEPFHGAESFEHFLEDAIGGVMFISAMIYKTAIVQEALASWPTSKDNLAAQAYWTAYCAARGSFIVTPTLHTVAVMGIGFTDKDRFWFYKIKFTDVPAVYMRLMLAGYSLDFCYRNVTFNLRSFASWRVLIGALRRWFSFSVGFYYRYLKCVMMSRRLYYSLSFLEKVKTR